MKYYLPREGPKILSRKLEERKKQKTEKFNPIWFFEIEDFVFKVRKSILNDGHCKKIADTVVLRLLEKAVFCQTNVP